MNKSSHVKQFLLPYCECYCNAAPQILFNSSVTPSAAFICSMMVSNRFCACSFRSARYVHPSVLSDGAVFLRQFQVRDVVISNKDIINSVFRYSSFQFAHIFNLLILVFCFCKSDSPEILVNHW